MFFVAKITTFKIYETYFIHIKTLEGSEVEKRKTYQRPEDIKQTYIYFKSVKCSHAFEIVWICIIKC